MPPEKNASVILINLTSPIPILGLLGGIFHFDSIFKRKKLLANSGEIGNCKPMSHKKDARLIWVKVCCARIYQNKMFQSSILQVHNKTI